MTQHRPRARTARCLFLGLALCAAAGAQDPDRELTRYLDLGPSAARPLTLFLGTSGTQGRRYDLSRLTATLTPVTPVTPASPVRRPPRCSRDPLRSW